MSCPYQGLTWQWQGTCQTGPGSSGPVGAPGPGDCPQHTLGGHLQPQNGSDGQGTGIEFTVCSSGDTGAPPQLITGLELENKKEPAD